MLDFYNLDRKARLLKSRPSTSQSSENGFDESYSSSKLILHLTAGQPTLSGIICFFPHIPVLDQYI